MMDDPGQYVLACELPHEPEPDDHEELNYAQWGTGPDRFHERRVLQARGKDKS